MERRARVGANEAVFRNVNERLENLNEAFETLSEAFNVVCECGNAECLEQIPITATAYNDVRADAALFIVLPGHADAQVEDVVEQTDDYEVVRKREGPQQRIAEATDPRS
jgi:hypothetical protein